MTDKDTLGRAGEKYAAKLIKEKGYKIIATNIKTVFSEVDIVAIDKDTLVFVEVKTRSNKIFGHPLESVGKARIERLKRAIKSYSKNNPTLPKRLRIDVISLLINNNKINEIRLVNIH